MGWEKGLNFSQTKYKVLNNEEFIPHVRPNFRIAIPRKILENFKDREIVLINIKGNKVNSVRIKKLKLEGKSYTISFKAEKKINDPIIKVLNVISESEALSRNSKNTFSLKNFIPQKTLSSKGSTPIYLFENGSNLVVGGYYKKDIRIKNQINFNAPTLEAIGLYFAEGGKTSSSFTNSWPSAINSILDFMEDLFDIKKREIKTSICCNYSLNKKKNELEKFWSTETGVYNFSKSLHFNKNTTSSQGILELYFCSEVIKTILINLINDVLNYDVDLIPLLRGVFSGDGSPILQNKYYITHNLSFNNKEKKIYFNLLKKVFPGAKIKIVQHRFVVYTSWEENKRLLFEDIYKFNTLNRAKFVRQFFSLPKTKQMLISDSELQEFMNYNYKNIISELLDNYRKLVDFKVQDKNFMKEKEREWIL